jgi:hypothetical protein
VWGLESLKAGRQNAHRAARDLRPASFFAFSCSYLSLDTSMRRTTGGAASGDIITTSVPASSASSSACKDKTDGIYAALTSGPWLTMTPAPSSQHETWGDTQFWSKHVRRHRASLLAALAMEMCLISS